MIQVVVILNLITHFIQILIICITSYVFPTLPNKLDKSFFMVRINDSRVSHVRTYRQQKYKTKLALDLND